MDDNQLKTNAFADIVSDMLNVGMSRHLLDRGLTILDANDNFYKLIGRSKQDLGSLFSRCFDFSNTLARDAWNEFVGKFKAAHASGETKTVQYCQVERKNGKVIWLKLFARFTGEMVDGVPVMLAITTDATEIKQLRLEREFTSDNLPGFIAKYLVGKKDITLVDGNEKLLDFFGISKNDISRHTAFSNIADTSRPLVNREILQMRRGQPVHFLAQVVDKQGDIAWMQVHGECIGQQDSGKLYLLVYIDITDITEQRALHKELKESAEKMRAALEAAEHANLAKSDFMARMSHDLRTPMNAIVGMATIAGNNLGNREKVADCLDKIHVAGKHLLGLINDVLDMSKIDSGKLVFKPEQLILSDFLTNVFTIVQQMVHEKALDYSVRLINVEHEEIIADELRLRQVFINIISNACKFTPVGGRLAITVEEKADQAGRSNYVFTFTDSGIGMKPEFVDHVFDVFSRERDSRTDKIEGSGLGMAITKRVIEQWGGSISVKSVLGKGTSFIVTLPFETREPSCDFVAAKPYSVLLLGDPVGFSASEAAVKRKGITVDCVETADEAISRFSRGYDMAILDWKKLGNRADETIEHMRGIYGGTIIAAAVYDRDYYMEEMEAAGVSAFVTKPIFASTICNAVQRYLVKSTEEIYAKQQVVFDFTGKRFLIVEDNELNREIAEELLRAENADIVTAVNGEEGLEKFAASKVGDFDLILMDVQMPVMNGYEATRAIRRLNRPDAMRVPIIAMTADAFAEDIEKSFHAGMNGHISKPLDIMQMYRMINSVISRS